MVTNPIIEIVIQWQDLLISDPTSLQRLNIYTDENGCISVMIDLQIQLPSRFLRDTTAVKIYGRTELCLPLHLYYRMFPENLNSNYLPKPGALPLANHVASESYTDVLPVHGKIIIKEAHDRTKQLMPVCFFLWTHKTKL